MKLQLLLISIVGGLSLFAATYFTGKTQGSNAVKRELLPKIEHLESQVSKRDTLILGYKLQVDECVTGLIATRDSLSQEIETLIKNRPRRRPYNAPTIPVSNNDELLSRAIEFLDNPQ